MSNLKNTKIDGNLNVTGIEEFPNGIRIGGGVSIII